MGASTDQVLNEFTKLHHILIHVGLHIQDSLIETMVSIAPVSSIDLLDGQAQVFIRDDLLVNTNSFHQGKVPPCSLTTVPTPRVVPRRDPARGVLPVVPSDHIPVNSVNVAEYQKAFERIRDELKLNPNHRPHDGRTHFVTMAKRYGVDKYAIKYMVGHKISDITETVYTRREFNWLWEEIEKIK